MIADAFDQLDSDDSGYISIEVSILFFFKAFMMCCTLFINLHGVTSVFSKNLRDMLGHRYSKEQVEKMMKEADVDLDGQLSYEEFISIFQSNRKMEIDQVHRNSNK